MVLMEIRFAPGAPPLTSLPSPMPSVALWQLHLDGKSASRGMLIECLNAEEQARAANLRLQSDRLRYAATRAALRALLGRRLDLPADSLRFETGPHGKPWLDISAAPGFNVSHAGDFAWIALAEGGGEVGVDIEWIDPGLGQDSLREMATHCLTARERDWLETMPAAAWPEAFHLLWTAQEALLKALGLGIADHLQHVSVAVDTKQGDVGDAHGARWLTVRPESGQLAAHTAALARTRLYRLDAPPGYAAAMAWLPPF